MKVAAVVGCSSRVELLFIWEIMLQYVLSTFALVVLRIDAIIILRSRLVVVCNCFNNKKSKTKLKSCDDILLSKTSFLKLFFLVNTKN